MPRQSVVQIWNERARAACHGHQQTVIGSGCRLKLSQLPRPRLQMKPSGGNANRRKKDVMTTHTLMRSAAVALLSVGVAITGMGLSGGSAQAQPGNAWPGCPPESPGGPCRWCPGDPPVQTGNPRTNPVVWDHNVCHTYWYVLPDQGNVAKSIFEGEAPPPPPPPPPGFTPPLPPGWCWAMFLPGPCPPGVEGPALS